ncbi:MAG: UDP-N-acetylmuramoyl-L-alanyl-D-glutamate--2,6-diaminopimelate ligase [Rhodobacteraceae bacterium]|jgi:UDP-N-acetylmuramoyl-L-alanyl-D-glutamate--2,6-diaminopimelate ligase|uniref:UDP-N-acetylmuramoyl-L-alanyl-D-glutamate--2,6-diaminopimelate ligase n=1 Tax=Salipiger profundus TaxID=1229727 RepID=A0A1U7DC45_9RHOB|nr:MULTISPECIES: UDP-N-acetylmuramoyl-L-alanyl-D-glutamate--2,6-diaminopimelate ligase [Salipiger]APX25734.1 UDP-N-acetylmuramoylalanyl-D-glutamate--2,6-diaminopimelate ligase [Salipiger profundus]MAB06409.1 UDP-N-acetylmuramoyl-L-alanyl-D-glutamate--2,6-diaminopimelate ligase [Paracoccaceae bacterium]GGA03761.1 UDP-N-acetylmuramoyl-L-alanyl-D-glutamate--2,6-diaminopimelate ligase [Salipiger profundus]SFD57197.1 UDP-N-acetylmuramoylalanyl-D-glutamate--2,6-diaminopimelate ligase [Salipiger profu
MDEDTKSLSDLGLTARGGREAWISGISVDSRAVMPGHLFAALPGTKVHGAHFIETALAQGAVAVLTDAEGAQLAGKALAESDVALVIAAEPRQALAYACALFFGAQPATMIAVTGTNGKTSVASFVRRIWQELGLRAVNLGTTGVEGDWQAPLRHTTPDPITLHKALAEAAEAGVTHAAMEASSHGLDQRRLDGVQLVAAGFTNFTQDHLDYHADFEEYFSAKAGLFARVLPEEGTAVINIDDARGIDMLAIARARGQEVLTVGESEGADLRLLGQRFDATGQELRLSWHGVVEQLRLNLIGDFQGWNALLAAGLVISCGAEAEDVFRALPRLDTVRGRMQLAATRESGAGVYVDFAHTPDAISTAIEALRPHVMGRLIAVIGAGGDRDPGKRPLMGRAAAEHADVVIVTDDNPRSEEPGAIRAQVLEGAPDAIEVGDRAEAILRGVDMLGPGDALLLCGKGHETGQIVGDTVYPFDDVEQASVAVAALDGRGL